MSESVLFENFVAEFSKMSSRKEQIEYVLTGATRAPSTHNSQPWRFHIEDTAVRISRDTSVILPNSDKQTQYAHISIGFLLHHIYVLGTYLGVSPMIRVHVDGSTIGEVVFSAPKERKEELKSLAQAIFKRRNRRGNFTNELIPEALLPQLKMTNTSLPDGLVNITPAIVTAVPAKRRIGELTLETMVRLYGIPDFRAEMSRWIVPSNSSRKNGIPGYSLNQPFLLSLVLPRIIHNFNIGKLPGRLSAAAIDSAPVLFAFGSDDNPSAWLSIGYISSHIMLTFVAQGFDASVYVATAELPDIREETMRLCGLTTQLRFLFVAGKLEGSAEWRTPRIALADKLDP